MRMGMREADGECDKGRTRPGAKDDGAEERTKVKESDPGKGGSSEEGVTPEGMQRGSGCASSLRVWIDY